MVLLPLTVATTVAIVVFLVVDASPAEYPTHRHSLLHFPIVDVSNETLVDNVRIADLVQNAPSASTLGGAHILLDNDVDTKTPKYPMILLSKPRTYQDSKDACASLGEDMVQPTGYGNITSLLNNTPVAQTELKGIRRVWVHNNGNSKCTAFDRRDNSVVQLSCSARLPAICKNSVPRTVVGSNDKSKQITVTTSRSGTYQGYRDQNAFRFLGIPYAQAPVGDLRFMAPKKWTLAANRKGNVSRIMNATEFGNVCTQLTYGGEQMNKTMARYILGADESEDCLYLNVFSPALKKNKARGLPVMVYVHGGSYTSFSGSSPAFEPGNLVSRGGVVVVTLNYRLSIFGLFENYPAISRTKAPGNLAVRDQIAALLWVRENIGVFGGNPAKVTIFGESAGAYSMRALVSAPTAFGLYHNVIFQSDILGIPFSSPKVASAGLGATTMQALGCKGSDLACAQNKTVDEIQAAQTFAMTQVLANPQNDWIPAEAIYRPDADRSLIPADFAELVRTGRYNKKANIMWGTTRDEAAAFLPAYFPNPIPIQDAQSQLSLFLRGNRTVKLLQSPYYKFNSSDPDTVRNELSKATTDLYFGCAVKDMSRGVVATGGSKVYAYQMDHGRAINSAFGEQVAPFCQGRVCHGDDIVPSFGSGDLMHGVEQTGDDARFARQVIDRFSVFAKTGNPNPAKDAPGLASQNEDVLNVQWPAYNAQNPVFHFDVTNSSVINNEDTDRCNWIAQNVQYDYQVHGPGGKFLPIFPPIATPKPTQTRTRTASRTSSSSSTSTKSRTRTRTRTRTPVIVPSKSTTTTRSTSSATTITSTTTTTGSPTTTTTTDTTTSPTATTTTTTTDASTSPTTTTTTTDATSSPTTTTTEAITSPATTTTPTVGTATSSIAISPPPSPTLGTQTSMAL
ncbi:hypothetical protein EMPS_10201 [Entomortierella parvispora]|uniref:Carboxylesterase type B domain-containing protein n=1 Tax=Entomortierella parvispora TaxID=205924 RepID=A0A9P3M137_9FUNG|nr:hypothetical protein EMPS_10201 [Entomortierella parvispora]